MLVTINRVVHHPETEAAHDDANRGLDPSQPAEALLSHAVEANVRHTVDRLRDTEEARARRAIGDMKLVGAVYELGSGRVRFLE